MIFGVIYILVDDVIFIFIVFFFKLFLLLNYIWYSVYGKLFLGLYDLFNKIYICFMGRGGKKKLKFEFFLYEI